MEEKEVIMTQEVFNKLKEELEYLKGTKKMEIAERIKIARDHGDLSENSEYDDAKNDQALLEIKINELESSLRMAKILDNKEINNKTINVGNKVKLFDYEFDEEVEYSLVSATEVNLDEGKISTDSPIGKGLIGKKKNEDVYIETPGGVVKYKVLSIKKI